MRIEMFILVFQLSQYRLPNLNAEYLGDWDLYTMPDGVSVERGNGEYCNFYKKSMWEHVEPC